MMHVTKYALTQLFPTLKLNGVGKLTLSSNNTSAQFVWVGKDPLSGTLEFTDMPASVATAMRANQSVQFTIDAANQLRVTGLTSGQLMLLAPRFFSAEGDKPSITKVKKPYYKPRQEKEGSDLTYSFKA